MDKVNFACEMRRKSADLYTNEAVHHHYMDSHSILSRENLLLTLGLTLTYPKFDLWYYRPFAMNSSLNICLHGLVSVKFEPEGCFGQVGHGRSNENYSP